MSNLQRLILLTIALRVLKPTLIATGVPDVDVTVVEHVSGVVELIPTVDVPAVFNYGEGYKEAIA